MKTQQIKRRGGILPSAGKAFLVSLLALTLVFTTIFQFGSLWSVEEQNTASATTYTGAWEGNDAPTPLQADVDPPATGDYSYLPRTYAWPYPWSRNDEATGNWVADSYGLSAADAALFEPVTVDRLADVLTFEDGKYYVLFATPRSQAGQRLVSSVSALAKNVGANKPKKIYLFNPVIDDYQIDITTTGAVASWNGNNSHTVGGTWTYLKGLLANGGAVQEGQNVFDFGSYTADSAVFFSTTQNAPTLSEANKDDPLTKYRYISAAAVLTPAGPSGGPDATKINGVFSEFSGGGSDVRTDLDFARRFWNAGVNDFNYNGGTETDVRLGRNDLNLFPTANEKDSLSYGLNKNNVDSYTASDFPLEFVDFVEGFNRLNKAIKDKAYLNYAFATIGCHNSQAYISEFAKKAKAKGQKVYINDDTLDGSFRFGATVATAGVKNSAENQGSTANGWLSARNSNYNFSYLYGHTIEYLGDKAISKNETYKNNSIQYYYNGDTSNIAAKTALRSDFNGYNVDTLAAAPAGNAVRLQIPFIFAFNGKANAASAVVPDNQFLHRKVTDDGRYSEYMMELSTVWGSDAAKNSKNGLTTDEVDGYDLSISGSAVKYAQEGRDYSLNNIFNRVRTPEPTDLFVRETPPTPVISGVAKVGNTVGVKTESWPQPRTSPASATLLTVLWKVGGRVVKQGPINATNGVYKIVAADAGKKLTVSITGKAQKTNPYYVLQATKTSAEKKVAIGTLKTATPKISGKAKAGKKLTAKPGTWTAGTKFTYQWFANNKKIAKATKKTFTLTKKQKGKKITVKVTGKKTGYATASKTSKPTAKVKK